jgi:hypothetical protein
MLITVGVLNVCIIGAAIHVAGVLRPTSFIPTISAGASRPPIAAEESRPSVGAEASRPPIAAEESREGTASAKAQALTTREIVELSEEAVAPVAPKKFPKEVKSDTRLSRLEAGQQAIAIATEKDSEEMVAIYVPDFDPTVYAKLLRPDFDPHSIPQLRSGDRLTIVEDAGDISDPKRRVRVKVENGQIAGHPGEMAREDIRPIARSQ